jgi:hypothetical protein
MSAGVVLDGLYSIPAPIHGVSAVRGFLCVVNASGLGGCGLASGLRCRGHYVLWCSGAAPVGCRS